MTKYLNEELVKNAFDNLRAKGDGKLNHERSTAIFVALSFNAISHKTNEQVLDLSPDSDLGKYHRDLFKAQYEELVAIESGKQQKKYKQIWEFGVVKESSKSPSVKLSSNFLTTRLKKASTMMTALEYPGRPKGVPLLLLGEEGSGVSYKAKHTKNWFQNIPTVLRHAPTKTPLIDLALLVFRDVELTDAKTPKDNLQTMIATRFTQDFSEWWIERLEKELIFRTDRKCLEKRSYRKQKTITFDVEVIPDSERLRKKSRKELVDIILRLQKEIRNFKRGIGDE